MGDQDSRRPAESAELNAEQAITQAERIIALARGAQPVQIGSGRHPKLSWQIALSMVVALVVLAIVALSFLWII